MKKESSLKKNFIMNAVLRVVQSVYPIIVFPYISRILLPEGMGKVSFAISVVTYFDMFAQLGIPTYGIRACAKVRDDREKLTRTVHEIFSINTAITILVYIVFAIAIFVTPRLQKDKILFLIVSSTMFFNTIGMVWFYKALEQYAYITICSIIFKFIALAAMLLLIHGKSDYIIYAGISVLASSAFNILYFVNIHKYIEIYPVGNYNVKQHLKPIVVFFAMSCATTVYTNLDTVMLGFMKTDADVGYYNAAIKIKTILVSLVTSLGTVLLPRASYYAEHGMKEEFHKITCKAVNFVFLFAVPLMIYFIFFAKEVIFSLSGEAYSASIFSMQLIMPTLLLIGLSNIMGMQVLVPLGKEKVVLCSVMAGALVDLIINWILIPSMASAGAAIGTLTAEAVVTIWQYLVLKDTVKDAYKQVPYTRIIVGIVLASMISLQVKAFGLSYFLAATVSAFLFFGVYGLVLLIGLR